MSQNNEVVQKIKVFCRLRPKENEDIPFQYTINKDISGYEWLLFNDHDLKQISKRTQISKELQFNKIFDQDATQSSVYETVAIPIVNKFIDGYNGTIFSFGQTGSGKTYTMYGTKEERGVLPRAIEQLFHNLPKTEENKLYTVKLSYIEIYNDVIHDLLSKKSINTIGKFNKNIKMIRQNVKNVSEAIKLIKQGYSKRSTATTKRNSTSSRSHCICTLYLCKQSNDLNNSCIESKLQIVDLAGSERLENCSQKISEESRRISVSLFNLRNVIKSLTKKNAINSLYRSSQLTSFLIDSLGGNCFTALIANISIKKQWIEESMATCQFAKSVSYVKNKIIKTAVQNRDKLNDINQTETLLREQLTNSENEIILLKNKLEEMKSQNNKTELWEVVFNENRILKKKKKMLNTEIHQLTKENAMSLTKIDQLTKENKMSNMENERLNEETKILNTKIDELIMENQIVQNKYRNQSKCLEEKNTKLTLLDSKLNEITKKLNNTILTDNYLTDIEKEECKDLIEVYIKSRTNSEIILPYKIQKIKYCFKLIKDELKNTRKLFNKNKELKECKDLLFKNNCFLDIENKMLKCEIAQCSKKKTENVQFAKENKTLNIEIDRLTNLNKLLTMEKFKLEKENNMLNKKVEQLTEETKILSTTIDLKENQILQNEYKNQGKCLEEKMMSLTLMNSHFEDISKIQNNTQPTYNFLTNIEKDECKDLIKIYVQSPTNSDIKLPYNRNKIIYCFELMKDEMAINNEMREFLKGKNEIPIWKYLCKDNLYVMTKNKILNMEIEQLTKENKMFNMKIDKLLMEIEILQKTYPSKNSFCHTQVNYGSRKNNEAVDDVLEDIFFDCQ